ncbi:MAG: glycerophosphodiester phosphodiesterase family protein [Cyclobacteriaceae bacterium]
MNVDMVEIDVRMTKDSVFILMHDDTIDRTTNGSGRVEEMAWAELKELRLIDPLKAVTNHKIPTLEQALSVAEGKILLNLDKVYGHIDPITVYLKRKDLLSHVVFKGWMKTYQDFQDDFEIPLNGIHFMPIVSLDEENWRDIIDSYSKETSPVAFEILFNNEGENEEAVQKIKSLNSRVWINSLWATFNAGHDDERAVHDVEGSYGWLISQGASIIQTDRPKLLLDYIQSHGMNSED